MRVHITRASGNIVVAEISGDIGLDGAGRLLDALVAAVGEGSARLIADFSGVRSVVRAGTRGIVVAAKLLRSRRGEMRICCANESTGAALRSLGFEHLLKFDSTRAESIAKLTALPRALPEGASPDHGPNGKPLLAISPASTRQAIVEAAAELV